MNFDQAMKAYYRDRDQLGIGKQRSNKMKWIQKSEKLPPEGEVVETKIDDSKGERNIQPLKRQGRLWYFPDGSMYVYYTPTHWRRAEQPTAAEEG